MKDEIKEILDKLKDNDWYEELDLTGTKWIELKQEETNQLLNYITNLQQENERLKKENTILKENAEHNDKVVDKARWNEMIYKSRCEKAIEYINKNKHLNWYVESIFTDELLNILNGGDEE